MNNILVFDNFLSSEDFETANKILKQKAWYYGHSSNGRENVNTPFWSANLFDDIFFSKYILSLIEKNTNKKFVLKRVYANGQTYGQNGSYHQDSIEIEHYTFCLYINNLDDSDIETAGGMLLIKEQNNKFGTFIEPNKNRGVLFKSNLYHKGISFNRYITDMRICIAWKLEEIIYLDKI